jgi:hypothetical protein
MRPRNANRRDLTREADGEERSALVQTQKRQPDDRRRQTTGTTLHSPLTDRWLDVLITRVGCEVCAVTQWWCVYDRDASEVDRVNRVGMGDAVAWVITDSLPTVLCPFGMQKSQLKFDFLDSLPEPLRTLPRSLHDVDRVRCPRSRSQVAQSSSARCVLDAVTSTCRTLEPLEDGATFTHLQWVLRL